MNAPAERNFFASGFAYVLLAAAAIAVYANTFGNLFVFDDMIIISRNRFITGWEHLGAIFSSSSTAGMLGGTDTFFRPMQMFAYLVFAQLGGLTESTFHFLNLSLHVANACLVFTLGKRLGLRAAPAFFASLIWALHPLHTEAITYMSGTADPLAMMFGLSAILFWLAGGKGRKIAAALCLALALLSKEPAMMFPALLLVCIYFRNGLDGKQLRATWPLWLLLGVYFVLRFTVWNFVGHYDFYQVKNVYTENLHVRLLTFLATLPGYASLLVAPFDLRMERTNTAYVNLWSLQTILGFIIAGISAGIALLALRGKGHPALKPLSFGVLWFFVAYAPCSGIALAVNAIFLEHWMYLPSAGLFLGIAGALDILLKDAKLRKMAAAAALAACVYFGVLTAQQNTIWREPIVFYNNILKYGEGTTRVYSNLAMAYDEAGQDALAEQHYKKALSMQDKYAETYYNYGRLMLKQERIAEAVAMMRKSLEVNPQFYPAMDILKRVPPEFLTQPSPK